MATEPRRWSPRLESLRAGAEAEAAGQAERLARVERLLRAAEQRIQAGDRDTALLYLADARAESNAAWGAAERIAGLMREARRGS
jgi:hypothetical protein